MHCDACVLVQLVLTDMLEHAWVTGRKEERKKTDMLEHAWATTESCSCGSAFGRVCLGADCLHPGTFGPSVCTLAHPWCRLFATWHIQPKCLHPSASMLIEEGRRLHPCKAAVEKREASGLEAGKVEACVDRAVACMNSWKWRAQRQGSGVHKGKEVTSTKAKQWHVPRKETLYTCLYVHFTVHTWREEGSLEASLERSASQAIIALLSL
eukprot:1157736-Pelagomonas_calceolata.AAC.2